MKLNKTFGDSYNICKIITSHWIEYYSKKLKTVKILDVGMGYGYLGIYLNALGIKNINLVGTDYVPNKDNPFYSKIIESKTLPEDYYDITVLSEVIEHTRPEDGLDLLYKLASISDRILITTPAFKMFQQIKGLPAQTHHTAWDLSSFLLAASSYFISNSGIGGYVLESSHILANPHIIKYVESNETLISYQQKYSGNFGLHTTGGRLFDEWRLVNSFVQTIIENKIIATN